MENVWPAGTAAQRLGPSAIRTLAEARTAPQDFDGSSSSTRCAFSEAAEPG
jgi:hypothetical protein